MSAISDPFLKVWITSFWISSFVTWIRFYMNSKWKQQQIETGGNQGGKKRFLLKYNEKKLRIKTSLLKTVSNKNLILALWYFKCSDISMTFISPFSSTFMSCWYDCTQTFLLICVCCSRMAGWDSRQCSWKKGWQQLTSIMATCITQLKDCLSVQKELKHIRWERTQRCDATTILFFLDVNTADMKFTVVNLLLLSVLRHLPTQCICRNTVFILYSCNKLMCW